MAVTAGVLLWVIEQRNPGNAEQTIQSGVDVAVPMVHGISITGGETLAGVAPLAEGTRQAVAGLGVSLDPMTTATEPTLPAQPNPGG